MKSKLLSTALLLIIGLIGKSQTLEVLHAFNVTNESAAPFASLTIGSDNYLYGVTGEGGFTNSVFSKGMGSAFVVTTNGTLTTLAYFNFTNGAFPHGALVLGYDGILYGTTTYGGISNSTYKLGMGTIFTIDANRTFRTLLLNFTNEAGPSALTLGNDGKFYGRAGGKLFNLTTNGEFSTSTNSSNLSFNGALTLGSDGNFYGTTYSGGSNGEGSVFRITTNGMLTTLLSFNTTNGAGPEAALTIGDDGNLYGTTTFGGSNTIYSCGSCGDGTIFKITTNGILTTLKTFNSANSHDGYNPFASLTLGKDGYFYGTTASGGNYGGGTVFKIDNNGNFITLASFNAKANINPNAMITGNDGNLYGTTVGGGTTNSTFSLGMGTIFRLDFPQPPNLSLQFFNGNPQLTLAGSLSNNLVVQYTANLEYPKWTNHFLITNLTTIPIFFVDSNADQSGGFYRLIAN